MVGTSSCYKSVYCTLTVFTVRAWILKLPLFCASVCMTFVFYALYSYAMCLSPVVMHYRNDTKSFFFFSLSLHSAENGIIKSEKVYEVMLATDRSHFSRCNPYMDSPQSIGMIPEPLMHHRSFWSH